MRGIEVGNEAGRAKVLASVLLLWIVDINDVTIEKAYLAT